MPGSVSADYLKTLNLRAKPTQKRIIPRRRNCQVLPSVPTLKPRPLPLVRGHVAGIAAGIIA